MTDDRYASTFEDDSGIWEAALTLDGGDYPLLKACVARGVKLAFSTKIEWVAPDKTCGFNYCEEVFEMSLRELLQAVEDIIRDGVRGAFSSLDLSCGGITFFGDDEPILKSLRPPYCQHYWGCEFSLEFPNVSGPAE